VQNPSSRNLPVCVSVSQSSLPEACNLLCDTILLARRYCLTLVAFCSQHYPCGLRGAALFRLLQITRPPFYGPYSIHMVRGR